MSTPSTIMRPFIFVTAADLLAEPHETNYVIEGLLSAGGMLHVYGRQEAGKSRLMLQLANALILGESFLGFPVRRPGKVCLLSLDMSESALVKTLEDARAEGLHGLEQGLVIPRDEQGTLIQFDALNDLDAGCLQTLVREHGVSHLIADAATDFFRPDRGSSDVNETVGRAVKRMQRIVGRWGSFTTTNHKRKSAAGAKRGEDDPDGFSGPSAWERKADASFELVKHSNALRSLVVRKSRLAPLPFAKLDLQLGKHGFFEVMTSWRQKLETWPDCVPRAERDAAVAAAASIRAVLRDVAERTGQKLDTVKSEYHRRSKEGYQYRWLALLPGAAGDEMEDAA